ncbi:tRNA-splicing endonuclease subunit sen54 [Cladophialophora chaetospira]|uniref:tRNA-splicing endonuclease subunit sen54 n=1 Tax=Cladophialophora chaetospira TaxID=386627 RepID=A0AA38X0G0_9EURO|nr:tRNA-splicing endonuclease subunit sen54 [Cladophialophora chaetospira]
MADADEDAIPLPSTNEPDDLEDETQDFRFLNQLTSTIRTGQPVIPKRGTKDFEPNPTRSQASALDASRLAMHTALSSVRIHAGKSHVVGQYLPNEEDWRWDEDERGVRYGRCVVVQKFKSTHVKTMGVADRNNWTWFLPEEALWLLERGNLDIRWPDAVGEDQQAAQKEVESSPREQDPIVEQADVVCSTQEEDVPESSVGELPMSVQGAYASLIGKDGLTLERYTVYAALKRTGYIVQRAPTWHDTDPPQANGRGYHAVPPPLSLQPTTSTSTSASSTSHRARSPISNVATLVHRLVSYLFAPQRGESCPSYGPLVAPGLYRNYTDIFRALALIPYHDPILTTNPITEQAEPPQAPYQIHFHIWKPSISTTYKKTSPPPPDYRICIIDARTTPSIPSLSQLSPLLDSQPDDSLSREKAGRLETRIKHGRKNVLLAVVDMGIVSYLRLSDACFGAEKLFEEKARAGTKGARKRSAASQPRKPGQRRQS